MEQLRWQNAQERSLTDFEGQRTPFKLRKKKIQRNDEDMIE